MEKIDNANVNSASKNNRDEAPLTNFELEAQLTTIISGVQETSRNSISNVVSQQDVPPDGKYGWVVTLCVFLINAHTWGVNGVSLYWNELRPQLM